MSSHALSPAVAGVRNLDSLAHLPHLSPGHHRELCPPPCGQDTTALLIPLTQPSSPSHVQADNFFVPPLNLLSEKLRLSPSIAGITLLAIGNGAPDVFTAYAGLKGGDLQLVLG